MIRRLATALTLALAAAGLHAQFVAPYCGIQGTLNSSSGLAAKNATLSFSPSQVFFVGGSSVVVKQSQCATDTNGNVIGVGNPLTKAQVSVQFVGTLPPGNYYVEITWYDQFGAQTLASPETVAQLTSTGELQILPPVGNGPPQAVGMAVYIGLTSGGETLQGTTSTLTAQFTQAVPLGSPVGSITVTSGGQFAACPTAFTFTGGGGTGAAAVPVCSVSMGIYTITSYTGLVGGNNYVTAPTVSTNGTASVAPVLAANLNTTIAPPLANGTSCRVVCNDAGMPTGTGYNVSLVDASGNTLFAYPEMWQFFGPGSTYNLSQGIPYYHGQVTYPIPLLTIPYNHNPQSISGPLSLTGYTLYNVGAVGVGTSTPAWGVDVEGTGLDAFINAAGGFLVNGNGGAAGQCLASDGTAFDLSAACGGYVTIELAGSALPQRPIMNFLRGVTIVDNPTNNSTDVTVVAPKVVLALPATTVAANTCSTPATASLPGTVSSSTFSTAFASNPTAASGWGSTGGLVVELWPDAVSLDTLDWSICNQTGSPITPTAIALNVGVN